MSNENYKKMNKLSYIEKLMKSESFPLVQRNFWNKEESLEYKSP